VALAQLLLDKPNVLVLDEPTNHLDIASREALENALADFAGTILCVSHDRYFLDKVVQRLLILRPPGLVDFAGNYSQWVAKQHAVVAPEPARAGPSRRSSRPPLTKRPPLSRRRRVMDFRESELAGPGTAIADTEKALTDCQTKLAIRRRSRTRPSRGRSGGSTMN